MILPPCMMSTPFSITPWETVSSLPPLSTMVWLGEGADAAEQQDTERDEDPNSRLAADEFRGRRRPRYTYCELRTGN